MKDKNARLLILCLLVSGIGFSQNPYIGYSVDHLLELVEEDEWKSGKDKVDAYDELTYQLLNSDPTRAVNYASKVLSLADSINYAVGEAAILMRLGVGERRKGNFDLAIQYLQDALEIRKKVATDKDIASTYNSIGLIYKDSGDYLKASSSFKEGIALLINKPNSLLAKIYNNVGDTEIKVGNYQEAFVYLNASSEIATLINSPARKANALLNIANLYYYIGNTAKALKNYEDALHIFKERGDGTGQAKVYIGLGNTFYDAEQYEQSIKQYNRAIEEGVGMSKSNLMAAYLGKGIALAYLEEYQKALENFNIYLKYQEKVQNETKIANAYYQIGKVYARKSKTELAISCYNKALDLLPQESDVYLRINLFKSLYEIYDYSKKYKQANLYLEKVEMLKDSLNATRLDATNYKNNYALEKSEKEFVQYQLKTTRTQQKLITIALTTGIFLLSGIFSLVIVIRQQRQKRRVAEREVDDLLREIELETTYARLDGQDSLRHRIAQDLHDGLGNMLSTIKLYFSSIEEKVDSLIDTKDQYTKANTLLDRACEEVRKVSHEMQSANLTRFGLAKELQSIVEGIQESRQIEANLVTYQMEKRLDAQIEHQLYKIVQEITANILKHSKANKISIELSQFNDLISLVIEDNGIGFNPRTVETGIGIQGIKARVNQLNGTFNIDSEIGRGTSISIDIPHTQEV